MKRITKMLDEKMPLEKAEPFIKAWGQEGIGFGSAFPQMAETMYRNSRGNIDSNDWAEMRQHGIAISENPAIISFEEQEDIVLCTTAAYASEYLPELLSPLDLYKYLPKEEA